jgi:UPF0716 family protein affecting phage T7 exclusion
VSAALALLAIVAGLSGGYWAFKRFGTGGADAAYDGIALISSFFWIMAGIFAILGGFVALGLVLLVIFSYIGFSKGKKTKSRVRQRIAG